MRRRSTQAHAAMAEHALHVVQARKCGDNHFSSEITPVPDPRHQHGAGPRAPVFVEFVASRKCLLFLSGGGGMLWIWYFPRACHCHVLPLPRPSVCMQSDGISPVCRALRAACAAGDGACEASLVCATVGDVWLFIARRLTADPRPTIAASPSRAAGHARRELPHLANIGGHRQIDAATDSRCGAG